MLIRFWGTRGSLPAPLGGAAVQAKLRAALRKASGRSFADDTEIDRFIASELTFAERSTFGGNTSCVEADIGSDEHLILDLGSGVREFGNRFMSGAYPGKKKVFNILMSHPHWDHIMGFPFFVPAYVPGHTIRIYGGHSTLDNAFRRQHAEPSFPVDYSQLGASIEFVTLDPAKTYDIAGAKVRLMRQHHTGDSYGYRIEHAGRSLIYSTDSEHKFEETGDTYPFVDFFRNADLVIFDAMYSLADAVSIREDWGHSSNIIAVELCHHAAAKRLCLFHHDPNSDDRSIAEVLKDTKKFEELARDGRAPLDVFSAYDGLEIEL